MDELDVRIVKLEPLFVASVLGFGKEPEGIAHQKLQAFAKPRGYLDDPKNHRIFGFNNPNPSVGSPNYGYELWIEVAPGTQTDGEVTIRSFPGGLYAVARCVIKDGSPYDLIPQTWHKLVAWREKSAYKGAEHQWLEEQISPEEAGISLDVSKGEFILDLYLPIRK